MAAGQDGLDGAVVGRAVVERPGAGGLESSGGERLGQAQHALGGAQLLEDAIGEQLGNELLAARADPPGLLQAPATVMSEEARGLRRVVP